MNLKINFLGLLLILLTESVFSQEAVTTAGGESTGTGSVSFTIGQIVYSQISSDDNFIIQGVQQPFEIFSDGKNKFISLEYSVYPNPTVDYLTLKIINFNHQALSYKLYDTNGKLIKNSKLLESNTNIEMKYLQSAMYFLVVSNDLKVLKSFKIIKN